MADNSKINRTWLCSVVFLDIVNYSSQSVELQIKWKDRFNGYLATAIKDVQEDERVILDTGDGAACCFLGAPEVAMFAALEMWHSLLLDERDQQPPFRVRIGINLGPVKLVRDINGAPNAIGDGINAGQRIMSFAGENQILVSQSYFEVVSRLSDDYKNLFTLKGVETDKHIREHTVYHLSPPGVQHGQVAVKTPQQAMPLPVEASPQPSASPEVVQSAPQNPPQKARGSRSIPLLVGGLALVIVVVAAAVAWRSVGPAAPAKESASSAASPAVAPSATATPNTVAPSTAASPAQSAPAPPPAPLNPAPRDNSIPAGQAPVVTASSIPRARQAVVSTPVASAAEEPPAPPRAQPRPGEPPFETSPPVLRAVSPADRDTARDLRERYASDASRAATAWRNAEGIRRNLAARGMSLNAQTASSLDRLGLMLDEAADAMREHKWDDALSSLQAVEAITQKVNSTVGN